MKNVNEIKKENNAVTTCSDNHEPEQLTKQERNKLYYEQRKEKLKAKRRERYQTKKSEQLNAEQSNPGIILSAEQSTSAEQLVRPTVKTEQKLEIVQNIQVEQKSYTKENLVKPKIVQTNEIEEIAVYNKLVYQRAGTHDPARFFTFPNGRKIVRTKCGCNPVGDFYDWCRDDCKYFTNWRATNLLPIEPEKKAGTSSLTDKL